jgi:hypothetical protein
MRARVVRGRGILDEIGGRLDQLHVTTRAPVMARRPWLQCWIDAYVDHEPWGVVLEDGSRLAGAALFANRNRRGMLEVVRLGHGATDHARLPALTLEAAAVLGHAAAREVASVHGPWTLHLGQLPVNDPALTAMVRGLRWTLLTEGDGCPVIRIGADRSPNAYFSRNHRQNSRKAMNRLHKDGKEAVFGRFSSPSEIAELLPEIDAVRRQRDDDMGRHDKLEDPQYASFRCAVLSTLAGRRELELSTLRIDGELAAYWAALLDGGAYRLWDGRMSSKWGWYAPGRLLTDASIERSLEDPRFDQLDFLRGKLEYKLRIANDIVRSQTLVAWSSSLVRSLSGAMDRGRDIVRTSVRGLRRQLVRESPDHATMQGGRS